MFIVLDEKKGKHSFVEWLQHLRSRQILKATIIHYIKRK